MPVNRIQRGTAEILLITKTKSAYEKMCRNFNSNKTDFFSYTPKRQYKAIIHGIPDNKSNLFYYKKEGDQNK
eukprot:Pgem_evm1s14987